jgi:hypothetical protein
MRHRPSKILSPSTSEVKKLKIGDTGMPVQTLVQVFRDLRYMPVYVVSLKSNKEQVPTRTALKVVVVR